MQIPAGSELPWLYGVARNVVANQRRGIGRRRRLAARILSHSSERRAARDVETSTDGPVEILEALASLSSSDQEVLRLRAWEELTTAEIAIVLGITSAAVDMRLSRAKRRLERALSLQRRRSGLLRSVP